MMWGYGYGWWPGMIAMSLSFLFFVALLAVLSWALVRWLGGRPLTSGPSAGPSALEILRQRYARGEIDTATYEEMRQRLAGEHSRDEPPVGAGT
jgi:putative membrane protein